MSATKTAVAPTRPALWWDRRVQRGVAQFLVLGLVVIAAYVAWFNITNNLRRIGISTDFGFLRRPVGVDIALSDLGAGAALWRALLVGVKNTLALVVAGVPILTVVGVAVGVARLSSNWLVARLATLYVEILRNIPPLLVILFVHNVFILRLPPKSRPVFPLGMVVSNFTISIPWFENRSGASSFWLAILVAVLLAALVWVLRTRHHDRTGRPHHRFAWSIATLVVLGSLAYLGLGRPVAITRPVFAERAVTGGLTGLSQYFTMLIALSLYTASHVAEIVRGSILAVPKGQTEAANALALSPFARLRYVILPQAMRIALPPIISQYLNFTKNTSLAIAVAYAEVSLIAFQAIGNANPAPQLILILMGVYLSFSLTISVLVNQLNRRLQVGVRR
jgi:general L-amino acid transport system permease protein